MKKVFFSMVFCLLLAVPAAAAVQEFERVKVDVPAGWVANAQGPVVIVAAPDGHAAITVTITPNGGQSPEATAKALAQSLNGSAPKLEDGVFVIEFENQGVSGRQYLKPLSNSEVMIISTAGDDAKLKDIVLSISSK
jgi:hypothetical protein